MTSEPSAPLPAGAVIGILGGGQLGRMLALAAHRLGLRAHIYAPERDAPAFDVTPLKTVARYDDMVALAKFSEAVAAITWEFENVPAEVAEVHGIARKLRGSSAVVGVAQDRVLEKRFIESCGLAVAPWQAIDSLDDLKISLAAVGSPAVLKTRRLGYDGKGQWLVREGDDLRSVFNGLKGAPAVLESFVAFEREVSVILARGANGATAAFDVTENIHENHILRRSTVPARVSPAVAAAAVEAARDIAERIDYVGVLGVEFFVTGDAERPLLVNEIAPRVHNSGHWTEAAAVTSQFSNHIRAVAGWPLGDPTRFADAEMVNLLGDEVLKASSLQGVSLHLYGKSEVRPGRKMGHTIRLSPLTR